MDPETEGDMITSKIYSLIMGIMGMLILVAFVLTFWPSLHSLWRGTARQRALVATYGVILVWLFGFTIVMILFGASK
jgi:hypothetical protein